MAVFYKLLTERVHQLMLKPNKWNSKDDRKPKVDDIVIFVYNDPSTGKEWKLARVIEVLERRVKLVYAKRVNKDDIPVLKILERSYRDVSVILSQEEFALNTNDYRKIISENNNL